MRALGALFGILTVSSLAQATPGDIGCTARVGKDLITVNLAVNGSLTNTTYGPLRIKKNQTQLAALFRISRGVKPTIIGDQTYSLFNVSAGSSVSLTFLDLAGQGLNEFALMSVNMPAEGVQIQNVIASCAL